MASNEYQAVEQHIEAALASIDLVNKSNIAALARELEVPETRLRRALEGSRE